MRDLFIGGRPVPAADGGRFDVIDPATGDVFETVANGTVQDAISAVDAAAQAAPAWAATAPRERGEILRRAYQLMTESADELARLISRENGKALPDALGEVLYAAEFFRWYSEEAVRVPGTLATAPSGTNKIVVQHRPVGICVLVTPWNFPAAMATRKIGPALAAGCTMVLKPASDTPLTALALARLLAAAGVPDRVLNVSMELGGNAPFLVFADADLDAAVEGAMIAKMRNAGEACTSANRFYVQAPVAEEFAGRLARRMSALKLGAGTDSGVQVGPLVNLEAVDKVEELVADAVARGAVVATGGRRPDPKGCFYEPTVLTDVPPGATLLREEIFGPVAPVVSFDTEEEAIRLANDTEYGLVAYLYTGDLGRGLRVSERLEAGMVGLNRGLVSDPAAPFGGVKQSGIGREGGHEGILDYLEATYVAVSW
jgi:succinate-semialdehyde dehydrogenase/glutarate-semialdehyde dehydrogenase